MGLLPTQKPDKPQLVDRCVWGGVGGGGVGGGVEGGGGVKLVLPQLDNGWSWGGVTTYPET